MNMGGRHISDHLLELLQRRGYPVSNPADLEAVRGLKENTCFVSQDVKVEMKVRGKLVCTFIDHWIYTKLSDPFPASNMQLSRETTFLMRDYRLPDGRSFRVDNERFMAPEALFDPLLADIEGPGIARMAFNAIQVRKRPVINM